MKNLTVIPVLIYGALLAFDFYVIQRFGWGTLIIAAIVVLGSAYCVLDDRLT